MDEEPPWQEQAQSLHGITLGAIPGVLQPNQAKSQNPVDCRGVFLSRSAKHGPSFRTTANNPSRIRTRNRAVQVGGGRQRFDDLIRKVIRENSAQPDGKLLPLRAARIPRFSIRHKFEPREPCVAKPADLQHNSIMRFLCHADHPPYERLLRAPQVQKSSFTLRMDFVLRAAERGKPLPVFADIGGPNGFQLIEGTAQLGCQLHGARIIDDRTGPRPT